MFRKLWHSSFFYLWLLFFGKKDFLIKYAEVLVKQAFSEHWMKMRIEFENWTCPQCFNQLKRDKLKNSTIWINEFSQGLSSKLLFYAKANAIFINSLPFLPFGNFHLFLNKRTLGTLNFNKLDFKKLILINWISKN